MKIPIFWKIKDIELPDRYFFGYWTGKDKDLICIKDNLNNEEVEKYLSPCANSRLRAVLKFIIKKFITWVKSFFIKKGIPVEIKPVETVRKELLTKWDYPIFRNVIKITAGGHHAWIDSRYGVIRKPLGNY